MARTLLLPYAPGVELERHERDGVRWEVARRLPARALRPLLGQALEGWALEGPQDVSFHELPFPGIPLILNLGAPWVVEGTSLDSFLAGLHTRPSRVTGERAFSCLELRLTPLGTRRLLGMPLHELANGSHALEELLPGAGTLTARVREAQSWDERFDLLEVFLAKRLADTPPTPRELDWAWSRLVRSGGRVRVRALATDLGWSPRRLIERFRDHVGLPPKAAARVIRLDRAVSALRSGTPRIAEVAAACGYADQAHLGRELRELGGITPGQLAAGNFVQDGVAATA
jgi:AraC-like DNA-binding protein